LHTVVAKDHHGVRRGRHERRVPGRIRG
jgi:hypothetical protein